MAQSLTLKIAGLHTSPNSSSEVPDGALLEATDITINQASVAEPRRGFKILPSSSLGTINRVFFYKDALLVHYGADTIQRWGGAFFVNEVGGQGTVPNPSGVRVKTAEANQNLYVTTAQGVKKISALSGLNFVLAGNPKGIDVLASPVVSATGFLTNGGSAPIERTVAYRVLWGIRDANNNLILGAPSQREVITTPNSASTTYRVDLTISIPAGITTSHFFQVYRSKTETGSTEPSDELQLVFEGNPTSGQITAGTLTVQDITPEALRGATIYTAQSQEGITRANERPPLCKDMAVFKDTMFFANYATPQRLTLTLLSVNLGTTLSLDDNDTVTIAGTTFTAKATPVAATDFQLSTGGGAAVNIRNTALALIRKINSQSTTVYAYYLSGLNELPGKILIEARLLSTGSFSVSSGASSLGAWNGLGTSTSDVFQNGIAYSKPNQPENVPLTNYFQVGSKDKAIVRIVPLRDSLFVFKDDGIFRISDDGAGGFQSTLFDSSAKILAPESPAVLNNQIYLFTDQGVTQVTDTGVSVVSRPIEKDLLRVQSLAASIVQNTSFGVAYEQDRKYLLFLPEASTDTGPVAAYVWDVFTSTWVRWAYPARCGVVGNQDVSASQKKDVLYLGRPDGFVALERKTLTYQDYCDFIGTFNITAISGATITPSTGTSAFNIGDVVFQGSSGNWATIIAKTTLTLTCNFDPGFEINTWAHLRAIPCRIKWAPSALNNPGITKQFSECTFIFRREYGGFANAGFSTDLSPGEEKFSIAGTGNGLWGLFVWSDESLWGGEQFRRPVRTWLPREKQVGTYVSVAFEHRNAFEGFELEGISLVAKTIGSSRVRR